MKKTIIFGGIACMALLLAGCGMKVNSDGFAAVQPGVIYTDMHSAQMVQEKSAPAARRYTVIGRVSAQATTTGYLGLISIGDASYATLRSKALDGLEGNTDLIDIEVDAYHKNIVGIVNEVTVTLTGTAIKY